MKNPFRKAEKNKKNLKMFIYGDSGVGKTTLALKFPEPCVLDLEGGSDLYGDKFDFSVFRPRSFQETYDAIISLSMGGCRDFETVVVDPITMCWEGCQKKWQDILLRRKKGSKGDMQDFFELQPKDWGLIKKDWKDFIQNLISLPLNVIVISREKPLYSEKGFMQRIGSTFDGEKSLPYYFDIVVRLIRDGGTRICIVEKDRSGKLGERFPLDYSVFERILIDLEPPSKEKFVEEKKGEKELEEKLEEINLDFLNEKVGFKKTGSLTWMDLIQNEELPDKSPGRQYLHKLKGWNERPEIAKKAKIALDQPREIPGGEAPF